MYKYNCIINRVIDGDTVDVDIDLGFDCWLKKQRIRLRDIDAPEVRTRDLFEKELGLAAKEFVEQHLPVGSSQVLHSYEYHSDKYGRIIGDFETSVDVAVKTGCAYLTNLMVEQGYAEVY
jgi:micrococcal nuclease